MKFQEQMLPSKTPMTDARVLTLRQNAERQKDAAFFITHGLICFAQELELALNRSRMIRKELRRLLRAANRGAERNAKINQMLIKGGK